MSDLRERVARAICDVSCIRDRIGLPPCIGPDMRNGPCEATEAQLLLSGTTRQADATIALVLEEAAMALLTKCSDAMTRAEEATVIRSLKTSSTSWSPSHDCTQMDQI